MASEPPSAAGSPDRPALRPALQTQTRETEADPEPVACEEASLAVVDLPDVRIALVTIPWVYGVFGYDGQPISAGEPSDDNDPIYGIAAGFVPYFADREAARVRAEDELFAAARGGWTENSRIIQEFCVCEMPAKDFREVLTPKLAREARRGLCRGRQTGLWWTLVRAQGCEGALLPVPKGAALFIFDRARGHIERRGTTMTVTLD